MSEYFPALSSLSGAAVVLVVMKFWLGGIKDDIRDIKSDLSQMKIQEHQCMTERLPTIEKDVAKLNGIHSIQDMARIGH